MAHGPPTGERVADAEGASSTVCREVDSPVGVLRLVAGPRGLRAVGWARDAGPFAQHFAAARRVSAHPLLDEAARQLAQYFAGRRRTFALVCDPVGHGFARRVWQALHTIPYGTTRTYGELAAQLGAPGAARAVGLANGKNPLAIVVPCHRVVGARGQLVGFAGGLAAKATLLALEGQHGGEASLPLFARLRADREALGGPACDGTLLRGGETARCVARPDGRTLP